MDLSPTRTVTEVVREKDWLGSNHGIDTTRTATLDLAGGSFDALVVTVNGKSFVPSGTAIRKGGDGLYDNATGVGVKADGHLFEDVYFNEGSATAGGALFWHGVVVDAQVPGTFADENRADHILYV